MHDLHETFGRMLLALYMAWVISYRNEGKNYSRRYLDT